MHVHGIKLRLGGKRRNYLSRNDRWAASHKKRPPDFSGGLIYAKKR
jgi:hypothetical protein